MKPDEEHCRDALERYLGAQYPDLPVVLEPGDNPPDYVATVADRGLNVEVTSVVAKVAVGEHTYEELRLFASLTKSAEKLCATLEAQPWFSGVYAIHLEPVPNLKHELPNLTERCLDYARKTALLESAPSMRLPFHWSIAKLSDAKPLAGYSLSASEPSYEGEIQSEITILLHEAVARKNVRTRHLPGCWVLLLLDRYHVADHEQWLIAAGSLDNHGFHSILRVHPHGDCWPITGSINIDDLQSNSYAVGQDNNERKT